MPKIASSNQKFVFHNCCNSWSNPLPSIMSRVIKKINNTARNILNGENKDDSAAASFSGAFPKLARSAVLPKTVHVLVISSFTRAFS